ncbi:MAG: TonB-dependent receptor [Bacteroidales bacterium]|nr:TonB-dependent receptor [Bacteroidales bacterium]
MKYLAVVLLLFSLTGFGQKVTISGYVSDAKTGEKLIGASVYDETLRLGTITNDYGFYSLTVPAGPVKFTVSYIGYSTHQKDLNLNENTKLSVNLSPSIALEEVVIVESRSDKKVKSTEMSMVEIPILEMKKLPVLLGEVDVMKTIQLLPGVQSGGEGTAGLYVRGGGPDQNLILLDGVPVYNVDHLFGFFSVFNADAISNVKLVKGGFPARYGGRLSSVLDIRMKEGNLKEFKGEGSIGIIASKLTLEGPIIKDRTSFIVSGRRTYIDVLAQPLIRASSGGEKLTAGYYFYDLNGKINHKFSEKSHLYLSAYTGRDKAYSKSKYDYVENGIEYDFKDNFRLQWGNITTALRWNYILNKKLFSNTTITYSKYKFLVGQRFEESRTENNKTTTDIFDFTYDSGIEDIGGKIDFDFIPNPNHYIRFGTNYISHTFSPGINTLKATLNEDASQNIDTAFGNSKVYGQEMQLYIEDDVRITALFKANVGLHYSAFFVKDTWYNSLQPRISARYLINEKMSIKAGYSQMNQYILLLANSGIGLPTDLWLPVTDSIKPMNSHQYVIGSVYALKPNLDLSIEGFYKEMNNLIEYKEGASFFGSGSDWETKVEMGKGWSYGFEVLLRKHLGKTTGWVGYTLSWSERQFENISFGQIFPYRYDRRHDISVVVSHQISDNVDISATWVFGTGNAVTLGIEKYNSAYDLMNNYYYNEPIEYFPHRNSFRMPAYHRMDIGINMNKKLKWGERTWSIGFYNVYNRKNPFYLYFGSDDNNNKVLKQVSLFPIIPSFRYSFKF